MTHREFVDWLRGVEEEFPVTRWKVRGIHAWPLIRLSLSASTFGAGVPEHALGAGWRRHFRNLVGAFTDWAWATAGDRRSNQRVARPADAVFLTYSIGRQPLLDGKRVNILAGPYVELLRRLGMRSLVWEMSPFGEYNVPRYTPSHFIQPYLIMLRIACQVLPLGKDRVELERYDEFVARVRAAGLDFAHADITRIRRDMLFVRRLADRFAGWLRAVRPSVGFVADTSLREQAFCLACRETGVTPVEVQHGVQGELHPSYGSWFAVPPEGYATRARVFWCWDEASASAINRWAELSPEGHLAVDGGDPWREMWVDAESEVARHTHAAIVERKRATRAERHVLITLSSQGEPLPPELVNTLRCSPRSWCFWVRLHPVNQARRRAEARRVLGALGIDLDLMEFATEVPLHAVLRHMDCHLTVGLSTVITQAAAVGVPSIACGHEAGQLYRAEADAGLLYVAPEGAGAGEALHQILGATSVSKPTGVPTPGWAPRRTPLDEMRRLLQLSEASKLRAVPLHSVHLSP